MFCKDKIWNRVYNILLEIFVIGLPSFFLALQPNTKPIKGRFLSNVAKNTLPAGVCLVGSVIALYIYQMFTGISTDVLVTMASIAVVVSGFVALFYMCKPFNPFKAIMFMSCAGICVTAVVFCYDLFKYVSLAYTDILFLIIICMSSYMVYKILTNIFAKLSSSSQDSNDQST